MIGTSIGQIEWEASETIMAKTSRKIFLNLPVRDLERSMAFFSSLGFELNRQFTDDKAACMVISDERDRDASQPSHTFELSRSASSPTLLVVPRF